MNRKTNDSLIDTSLVFSNPFNDQSAQIRDNQTLLDQMYNRIKDKKDMAEPASSQQELSGPLLSYVTQKQIQKTTENSKQIKQCDHKEPTNDRPSLYTDYPKKSSLNQRYKTQMNENSARQQIQQLAYCNQALRNTINKQQKRIAYLQCYQSQVQYLKKICFLQSTQIQKLRKMLKNNQPEAQKQNQNCNWQRMQSKDRKGSGDFIIVKEDQSRIVEVKRKCPHKKKSLYYKSGVRTQSTLNQEMPSRQKQIAKVPRELYTKKTISQYKKKGSKDLCLYR